MKLLFVHDHKFRCINGKIYSNGGLSDTVLNRYTGAFGSVTVIARVIKEEETHSRYSLITNNNVKIKSISELGNNGFLNEVKEADYIISRLPSFNGLKVIKIAEKLNKPYLVELVGCPWDSLWNHSWKGKLVAPAISIKTKKVVKNSPYVLYVTNEFLQKRYPTKGISIGVSDVSLPKLDEKILEKRLLKIKNSNEKIVLGTTAAVNVRYKGQRYVIEALGKLKKGGVKNFEYHLVGGGDTSYLQSIAEKSDVLDQVKFLGPKPHIEVFDWLDNIDVYVQPSRQEGLPRALVEAMSRGLPCFGANTGGIPELLESPYIFSNTSRNIDEICKILLSFSKENMQSQAKRNFNEAKKYDESVIEEKRDAFFRMFLSS